MTRCKSGLSLLKHKDTKLDSKILDCNLRRYMLFNRPFRFVYDGKQWYAYSHFDKCTTDLNQALLKTYMSGVYTAGRKAKPYCYDTNLKEQLKKWLTLKTDVNNPKNVKSMKAKKRDIRKSDLASCHKFNMQGERIGK
ncbi:MAG: hypothetical protein J6S67_18380 [Methanobrevibacter sp.]|nr:hypothetical protein [Methanobrevibacter sp.]